MSTSFELVPFDRATQGEELARILARAFNFPAEDAPAWWDRTEDDTLIRVLREGGRTAGTLLRIPMGHFVGGRAVPACGVAAVAMRHELRGRGAATWMMREDLREMRALGFALSSLYPSTIPLYRKAGYELAGCHFRTTIPLRAIGLRGGELALREHGAGDEAATEALYRRVAAERCGWLERGVYLWSRIRRPRNAVPVGFVVEGARGIEGYLWYHSERTETWQSRLVCTDLVAATPAAARTLLGFLAANGTMHGEATCLLPPEDPLLQLIPERGFESRLIERWMLRVLDPAAALERRGWPAAVAGALDFELRDDLFADNEGRWRLEVAGGEAHVARGGSGRLKLDVRQLAQLYTGFQSAAALARVGLLEAPAAELALACALFAGPPPSLPEMF